MKDHPKRFLLVLLIIFAGFNISKIQGQQTFAITGGEAFGAGGSISYTVGQVAYTTNTSLTGTVMQGVQLPYEIIVVTELEEVQGISLDFSVYPNPAIDFIKLKIVNYKLGNLHYQLYDINGSILQNQEITGEETLINMAAYISAEYYLQVSHDQKKIKTFKIVKN